MNHKTYVVTGSNTGIGKAIAMALAQKQVHVVLVSRNPQKGQSTVTEIQQATRHEAVDIVVGDLGAVASTHQLATTLLESYPHMSVLINNAGIWMTKRETNEDNIEQSFMVNHLAPFILSTRLLPCLTANTPGRIVNVNAGLYVRGKPDLDNHPYGKDFCRMGTYANTKLCNLLFTRELAKRIKDSGVTVNAVHPGFIRTHLGDTAGIGGMILGVVKRFWGTPEAGAQAPVWLATSPKVEGMHGHYFDLQTATEVNEIARDDALGLKLWNLSVALDKLETFPV